MVAIIALLFGSTRTVDPMRLVLADGRTVRLAALCVLDLLAGVHARKEHA